MIHQITDETIIQLKAGDRQAFTYLFECYWKKLFAIAYRRLDDEAQAQDVVQELFITLWDKRSQLHITAENLESYLQKSIKNSIINYFTSQQVKKKVLAAAWERVEAFVQADHDLGRYLELEDFVDQQVEKLPPTMKAVFLMKADHHSIATISDKLDLAEQTVKNNLTEASHRIRKSILKKISDEKLATILVAIALLMKN